ncbi:MAG TPA: NAD(P)-dependent oxidoreductase [Thermoanaerobaculia bacterium]|nr:NAD(P)-dependent oxidoreductase [Thermoanaerobaculia bacterium]
MKRLLIAADVDRTFVERVKADPRFAVTDHPVRTEEELLAAIGDAEILVTRAYNRVTKRVLDAAPHLELIAQGTSGIDNIDAIAAQQRGIGIVSLPGENANAVAELVLGFMLAMTRTVPFYTREVVAGRWQRDDCATRHELRHHLLGIIGLGQVGLRVARLARAFGMNVQAYDPYLTAGDFTDRNATRIESLHTLLATSDIVTLHVPLLDETRSMISSNELATMKNGAYLINASRGEVLDQQAALQSLATNHLGGLAMDVYDPEPPQNKLPDDPRLILTPHIAGCTFECKAAIGERLYEKVVKWVG